MSTFIGVHRSDLIEDTARGLVKLVLPFGYQSDVANQTFTAPAGFETDYCSVPRIPLAYEILGDKYRKSGTIHDWLYQSKIIPRELADEVLREMLLLQGATHREAMAFYLAVRQFGGSHWGPEPAILPLQVDSSGP